MMVFTYMHSLNYGGDNVNFCGDELPLLLILIRRLQSMMHIQINGYNEAILS